MSMRMPVLQTALVLLMPASAFSQQPAAAGKSSDVAAVVAGDLLSSVGVNGMLQIVTELRKSSEALERFGTSLKSVSAEAADAARSTSQNLAAIGAEFDPFGFKTAFKTIQRQNEIIQAQHEAMLELYQREIRRLEQERQPAKNAKRQPRRRKSGRSRNRSAADKAGLRRPSNQRPSGSTRRVPATRPYISVALVSEQ